MENHRTDSIPNDSYPVKSDRLLVAGARILTVPSISVERLPLTLPSMVRMPRFDGGNLLPIEIHTCDPEFFG